MKKGFVQTTNFRLLKEAEKIVERNNVLPTKNSELIRDVSRTKKVDIFRKSERMHPNLDISARD